ncbi:MAG: UvrD-helicase domain-containing protein [Halobacteriovoraceae bacterium]|nr:UvrD-helicase domain-containing protein [Halobacteriovoraceae bacterium]
MISLAGLNKAQRQAAETIKGPVLILAGAGTGKTRTITYRIGHMVLNLNIPPKDILAVSFTNKAAKEMRERVQTLLGKSRTRGMTLATFHSLGVQILKNEITNLGYHKNFSIYDTSDQLSIIRAALKNYSADKKAYDHKIILGKIGLLKNHGISESEYVNSFHFDPESSYDLATEYAYKYYQEKLRFYNAIDFDDILFLTVKLFRENPEIAHRYSENFKYIMIDEYQDTNTLQFQLVLALTSTHKNLCVVGDDDQAIYAFRGADISNILNFEKYFPEAKIIKLEENYRSTSPILNLANQVIKKNKNRRDKTLWSQNGSQQVPLLWAMGDSDHEAQVIVDEIAKYQSQGKHLADIAILYRSKTQVPVFEDELRMQNVPYTIIGGQKLYEKKEVKDLLAFLMVIQNVRDELSLRRILNIPNRGIGVATLNKYIEKANEHSISLFQSLEEFPDIDPKRKHSIEEFTKIINDFKSIFRDKKLPEAISILIERIDFFKFIEKQYDNPKQIERRKEDVMRLIESAERFEKFQMEHASLKTFIERIVLQDSQDKENESQEDNDIRKNEVTLMTLHSSKGLEFPIIYLIGVEEEILPHKKVIKEGSDISEELRLCYVGITRAKEKLIMSYCKERNLYGKTIKRNISRFLIDLKDKNLFLEQDRTTFGHLTEEEAKNYKKEFFSGLMSLLD